MSTELEILARSNTAIEVIKHKSKFIYGFQFHPEVIMSDNESTKILLNLIDLVKKR